MPIAVVCALTKFRQILLRGTFRYLESRCDFSVESLPPAKRYPFPDFSRAKSPIGVDTYRTQALRYIYNIK